MRAVSTASAGTHLIDANAQTAERLVRRRLEFVHRTVTRILATTRCDEGALGKVLAVMGGGLGWQYGEIRAIDTQGQALALLAQWHADDEGMVGFARERKSLACDRHGLCGRVFSGNTPTGFTDLALEADTLACASGLRGAFGFPLLTDAGPSGVMLFFCRQGVPGDESLTHLAESLGIQIGEVLARRRAEHLLEQAEERYRVLSEASPAGVFHAGPDGELQYVNERWTQMTGMDHEQAGRDGWLAALDTRDRPRVAAEWAAAVRSGNAFEAECRLNIDSAVWVFAAALPYVVGGRAKGFVGNLVDITPRKRAEESLQQHAQQLRVLSRKLVRLQDDEQRRLAEELHHRVSQSLTALSINLMIIEQQLALQRYGEVGARLGDSKKLVEDAIESIRHMMTELRPSVLDDYGLSGALHWYAEQFGRRTGIEVSVIEEGQPLRLGGTIENELLRVAQEACTNIAKYSGATRARIVIDMNPERVRLSVCDNGCGFDTDQVPPPDIHSGWGIGIMRARAESIGGRLSIESRAHVETRVCVEVPIANHVR